MNNKVLITLIIGVCIVAAAGIVAYGMMNANDTVIINNGTNNNTNHTNNVTVENTNNNDAQQSESASNNNVEQSKSTTFKDEDGFNHYFDENGNEMVGNPESQHMTLEQHQYVKEHGME